MDLKLLLPPKLAERLRDTARDAGLSVPDTVKYLAGKVRGNVLQALREGSAVPLDQPLPTWETVTVAVPDALAAELAAAARQAGIQRPRALGLLMAGMARDFPAALAAARHEPTTPTVLPDTLSQELQATATAAELGITETVSRLLQSVDDRDLPLRLLDGARSLYLRRTDPTVEHAIALDQGEATRLALAAERVSVDPARALACGLAALGERFGEIVPAVGPV